MSVTTGYYVLPRRGGMHFAVMRSTRDSYGVTRAKSIATYIAKSSAQEAAQMLDRLKGDEWNQPRTHSPGETEET